MPVLALDFMGAVRVMVGDRAVEVDTRKAIALLAVLAINGGEASRDTLAALLWPDDDQAHARAALRRTLSALNTALARAGGEWIQASREQIRLENGSNVKCDVWRFQDYLAACRLHGHPESEVCPRCTVPLQRAAVLFRGEFMAGFTLRDSPEFDEWQVLQAEAIHREVENCLERLAQAYTASGVYSQAISTAHRWLNLDPLREEAHRTLMRLYGWSGQRTAALQQYETCAHILDEELGVKPLGETQKLYRQLLDNQLPPPPAFPKETAVHVELEVPVELKVDAHPRGLPLVGRSSESESMVQAYQGIHQDGFFLAIEGEPGIGKTRLAEEFIAFARGRQASYLVAHCYEGESSLAFQPIIELLRSSLELPDALQRLANLPPADLAWAARLAPEVKDRFPGLPDISAESSMSQGLLFEALRQVFAAALRGPSPGIICLDDLQWADTATLEWVAYLVRRLASWPVLMITTWREPEAAAQPVLQSLISVARRASLGEELRLERLSERHVADLLRAASQAGAELPAGLAKRLFAEAEGLPFFIVEYLAGLQTSPQMKEEKAWTMPAGVRDLLHRRLANASETGQQLLSTAAAIGRSFDFDTLREASGRSEAETLVGLEELARRGLVLEQQGESAAGIYQFSHQKLRELVYEDTPQVRRRLLHRRIAEMLAAHARTQRELGEAAGQIARHLRLAGDLQRAAGYTQAAGDRAREMYANRQALELYEEALALGSTDLAGLHTAIGDLHTLAGDYEAALASFAAAASACPDDCRAGLETRIGRIHSRRGEWEQAESHYLAAAQVLEEVADPAERAHLLADLCWATFQKGDAQRAQQLAEEGLRLALQSGDLTAQARANNSLGMLARGRREPDEARQFFQESLRQAEQLGDVGFQAAALNNLALAARDCGSSSEAIQLTTDALELCVRQGDRHRQAALHNNLADLYHSSGDEERSMQHLKQAVAMFSEIGGEASIQAPGPWMLTEW